MRAGGGLAGQARRAQVATVWIWGEEEKEILRIAAMRGGGPLVLFNFPPLLGFCEEKKREAEHFQAVRGVPALPCYRTDLS